MKILSPEMLKKISKTYHEVLMLGKFLQTKLHDKIMNKNYYDLYYTVIRNRKEKDDEEEQKETVNDYINFNDFKTTNQYVGQKNDKEKLR